MKSFNKFHEKYVLIIFMCFIPFSKTDYIIVEDSGILPFADDDMALIFYMTLQNTHTRDCKVVLKGSECCQEAKPSGYDCKTMNLLGGDMGILKGKSQRNVTFIFPNLYLDNRKGTCKVVVAFQDQQNRFELTKSINFISEMNCDKLVACKTDDLDFLDNCSPEDCTIKYSGLKSYFNHHTHMCQNVPFCVSTSEFVPDVAYSTLSNRCKDLTTPVTRKDLQIIDKNDVAGSCCFSEISNVVCHHGTIDDSRNCLCFDNWATTPMDETDYEPRLQFYHMCNLEIGSWNGVNKRRLEASIIIAAIFTITIASKILILMCILNWCYKYIKKSPEIRTCTDQMDDNFDNRSLILCEKSIYDECECKQLISQTPNLTTSAVVASATLQKGRMLRPETVHITYLPPVIPFTDGILPKNCQFATKSEKSSSSSTKSFTATYMSRISEGSRTVSPSEDDDFEIEFSENEEQTPEGYADMKDYEKDLKRFYIAQIRKYQQKRHLKESDETFETIETKTDASEVETTKTSKTNNTKDEDENEDDDIKVNTDVYVHGFENINECTSKEDAESKENTNEEKIVVTAVCPQCVDNKESACQLPSIIKQKKRLSQISVHFNPVCQEKVICLKREKSDDEECQSSSK